MQSLITPSFLFFFSLALPFLPVFAFLWKTSLFAHLAAIATALRHLQQTSIADRFGITCNTFFTCLNFFFNLFRDQFTSASLRYCGCPVRLPLWFDNRSTSGGMLPSYFDLPHYREDSPLFVSHYRGHSVSSSIVRRKA